MTTLVVVCFALYIILIIMMHIKFLLPTALIKQPTRSQELPNDICLPIQGKVKKFKKIAGPLGNLWPKFTNSE